MAVQSAPLAVSAAGGLEPGPNPTAGSADDGSDTPHPFGEEALPLSLWSCCVWPLLDPGSRGALRAACRAAHALCNAMILQLDIKPCPVSSDEGAAHGPSATLAARLPSLRALAIHADDTPLQSWLLAPGRLMGSGAAPLAGVTALELRARNQTDEPSTLGGIQQLLSLLPALRSLVLSLRGLPQGGLGTSLAQHCPHLQRLSLTLNISPTEERKHDAGPTPSSAADAPDASSASDGLPLLLALVRELRAAPCLEELQLSLPQYEQHNDIPATWTAACLHAIGEVAPLRSLTWAAPYRTSAYPYPYHQHGAGEHAGADNGEGAGSEQEHRQLQLLEDRSFCSALAGLSGLTCLSMPLAVLAVRGHQSHRQLPPGLVEALASLPALHELHLPLTCMPTSTWHGVLARLPHLRAATMSPTPAAGKVSALGLDLAPPPRALALAPPLQLRSLTVVQCRGEADASLELWEVIAVARAAPQLQAFRCPPIRLGAHGLADSLPSLVELEMELRRCHAGSVDVPLEVDFFMAVRQMVRALHVLSKAAPPPSRRFERVGRSGLRLVRLRDPQHDRVAAPLDELLHGAFRDCRSVELEQLRGAPWCLQPGGRVVRALVGPLGRQRVRFAHCGRLELSMLGDLAARLGAAHVRRQAASDDGSGGGCGAGMYTCAVLELEDCCEVGEVEGWQLAASTRGLQGVRVSVRYRPS